MTSKWSPSDIQKLMAVTSACSCMVILICGVMIGLATGRIPVEALGSAKGIGVGGGLVGLAMVLFLVIRVALKEESKEASTGGAS